MSENNEHGAEMEAPSIEKLDVALSALAKTTTGNF